MEKYELTPGLKISRVITGLWQIADLEKDGKALDPVKTAAHMKPYVAAGFTTFDMADHYGSAELIAGRFAQQTAPESTAALLTTWCPEPGAMAADVVRAGVQRSLDRLGQGTIW